MFVTRIMKQISPLGRNTSSPAQRPLWGGERDISSPWFSSSLPSRARLLLPFLILKHRSSGLNRNRIFLSIFGSHIMNEHSMRIKVFPKNIRFFFPTPPIAARNAASCRIAPHRTHERSMLNDLSCRCSLLKQPPAPHIYDMSCRCSALLTDIIPEGYRRDSPWNELSKRRYLNIFFPSVVLLCDFVFSCPRTACPQVFWGWGWWLKPFSIFNTKTSILAVIFPS